MADRPIIMAAESVRAILGGRKTQSRRVLRERDVERLGLGLVGIAARIAPDIRPAPIVYSGCPYGAPGSRLWVREAFSPLAQTGCRSCIADATYVVLRDGTQVYRSGERFNGLKEYTPGAFDHVVWRSPIHMPRWASRLTLEILSVRVERVQAISEEDARAEGVAPLPLQTEPGAWWTASVSAGAALHGRTPADAFRLAWDAVNGRRAGCSWRDNPWCWCLSFRRVEAT